MFKKKKEPMKKEFKELSEHDLQELYEKGAKYVEDALNSTHDSVIALLDGEHKNFEKSKEQTLKIEDKSDDVHDYIIQKLYDGEALVFSRSDRLYIINQMDDIVDRSEDVILAASQYTPEKIPNPIAIRIVGLVDKYKMMGRLVREAIETIFKDFDATIPIVKNIEKLKSEAHRTYQEFFEKLFKQTNLPALELLYYERVVETIYRAIFVANKFADGLRRLIFKYRL